MKAVQILMLLIITVLFSCEKIILVNCEECSLSEPLYAIITISLSESSLGRNINEIKIYEGHLEDNILLKTLNFFDEDVKTEVRINKEYTITAHYIKNGVSYLVVDSVFPRIKYDKDQCESPCYYTYDKNADLRLKQF